MQLTPWRLVCRFHHCSRASQPIRSVVGAANVTFTVTASGFAPLAYQWYFNGDLISGATATNYSLAGVTTNQRGQLHGGGEQSRRQPDQQRGGPGGA